MSPSPEIKIEVSSEKFGYPSTESKVELLPVETIPLTVAKEFVKKSCSRDFYLKNIDYPELKVKGLFYIPHGSSQGFSAGHFELMLRFCAFAPYNVQAGCDPKVAVLGTEAHKDLKGFYSTTLNSKEEKIEIILKQGKKITLKGASYETGSQWDNVSGMMRSNDGLHALLALPEKAQKKVFGIVDTERKVIITHVTNPSYKTVYDNNGFSTERIILLPSLQITKGAEGEYKLRDLQLSSYIKDQTPCVVTIAGLAPNFATFVKGLDQQNS